MITNHKSNKWQWLRYGALLPIVAAFLMSFTEPDKYPGHSIPSIPPMKEGEYKFISSKFGPRQNPMSKEKERHNGIDFSAELGTPVYATGDGRVIRTKPESEPGKGYGNLIRIWHMDNCMTLYSHLDRFVVKDGDWVKKGQVIAYSGNSGRSTGPHLHYSVFLNGEPQDPEDYFME